MALIAPAGPVNDVVIERAFRRCQELGFEPSLGEQARSRDGYLAGTDHQRATDLTRAIRGDAAGIWALRGGYGTLRTLDAVDVTPLLDRPKAFIGFSDNTAVHLALFGQGLVSFHGPHAGFEHFPAATATAFRSVVMTPEPPGPLPLPKSARPTTVVGGTAEGPLVGGNLALLAASCGTRLQPDTRGAILFMEDVAEPPYRIDRMLTQLRLAGLLDDVAAIALGQFVDVSGTVRVEARPPRGADPPLADVFADLLAPLGVPVALGLPFGHGSENWTLPLGVRARLDAGAGTLLLLEAATTGPGLDR